MSHLALGLVLALGAQSSCSESPDSAEDGDSEGAAGPGTGGGSPGGAGGEPGSGCPSDREECSGTCVDLESDVSNCGSCENACTTGEACSAGSCECLEGREACGSTCVDTSSNPDHCGTCETVCPEDQVCSQSACADDCASSLTRCGRSCIDTSSSTDHCGECDRACNAREECSDGECECVAGSVRCGSTCVEGDSCGTGGGGSGGSSGTGGSSGNGGSDPTGGAAGGPTDEPCGNEVIDAGESCDDGGRANGDGCSEWCLIEDGYDCEGEPSDCRAIVCGDMVLEGNESCDDGNAVPFDGCSSDCRREPSCAPGMPCTSPCGDGIVLGDEDCDDGNRRAGDGCSATCTVEPGFECLEEATCRVQNSRCTIDLPVVFRDFNRAGAAGGHPDFQPGYTNNTAITGLVEPLLDAEGKPVLSSTATVARGFMHGQQSFAQWFRNGAPASAPIAKKLVLWDDGAGGFINHWGLGGENFPAYDGVTWCSSTDCAACGAVPAGMVCRSPCPMWGYAACFATELNVDGNPLFFPVDGAPGVLTDTRSEGKVPEEYGWAGWPWESAVAMSLGVTSPVQSSTAPFPSTMHNFHFTSEARFWFRYDSNGGQSLAFTGDDDAWIFINGRLAVDLGGWHPPLTAQVSIDATAYSLSAGNVYEVAVFHAERQTEGSTFRLGHTQMTIPRSRCRPR